MLSQAGRPKLLMKMPESVHPGSSPQVQSALLRSVLGISPPKERMGDNCLSTPISVKKTDLLKSIIGKSEEVEESNHARSSPPRSSQKNKKKNRSSGKTVTVPHFAGSAFVSSPHPDSLPLPDFDENFFD